MTKPPVIVNIGVPGTKIIASTPIRNITSTGTGSLATNVVQGPRGPAGPQGPKGDRGDVGPSGLSSFAYTQNVPSSSWMITHNLNKYPNVVTTDFDGNVFYGEIRHLDVNVALVEFTVALSGKAYLS